MDKNQIKTLIKLATKNLKNSYSPYSNYKVSAVLLASSGKTYVGVNIENSSYPAGICAERSALASAISSGEKSFKAVVIIADNNKNLPYPCGICRQTLSEFNKDMLVIVATNEENYKTHKLTDLLPHSFNLK